MTDRLLTAREVADMLGFSPETILRWWRRGDFEGVAVPMPGGAVRFRKDRLDAGLEKRATLRRGSVSHPDERRPASTLSGVSHPLYDEED